MDYETQPKNTSDFLGHPLENAGTMHSFECSAEDLMALTILVLF